MKSQWVIVCGLLVALFTAIVAVFNIKTVPLNYIFGEIQVSLIIIISTCILIGGFIGIKVRLFHAEKRRRD